MAVNRRARLAALALAVVIPSGALGGAVSVFAAASMKTALEAVGGMFEEASGHSVTLSLAGSSALARQIQHGAPADVFVSANRSWMDHLEALGRIDPATRIEVAGNRLALVVPAGDAAAGATVGQALARLESGDRVALALVAAVPAGIYARASLESLGLWRSVEPHVVQADNVRAALKLVAMGEADFGIVYATDARAEDAVRVVALAPRDSHPEIVYPAAAVAGRGSAAARDFLNFLRSGAASRIFAAQGFSPPRE